LGGIGRGARRPLHWNNPYPGLRGCYWELETKQLAYNLQVWQNFLQDVRNAFTAVQPVTGNPAPCSPGSPGKRCQDVLNGQSQIYLISCSGLLHPKKVKDWPTEGTQRKVRGDALDLLYDNRFKGVNQQGIGNANVGGRISKTGSTPSYVAIKSNFPSKAPAYQAVTIFGANQSDRSNFATELRSLTHLRVM
jgi:CRISPR-associated protein Cmr6